MFLLIIFGFRINASRGVSQTMAKVNWAVTAYNDWHLAHLEYCYDAYIFDANLNDVKNLTVDNLVYGL